MTPQMAMLSCRLAPDELSSTAPSGASAMEALTRPALAGSCLGAAAEVPFAPRPLPRLGGERASDSVSDASALRRRLRHWVSEAAHVFPQCDGVPGSQVLHATPCHRLKDTPAASGRQRALSCSMRTQASAGQALAPASGVRRAPGPGAALLDGGLGWQRLVCVVDALLGEPADASGACLCRCLLRLAVRAAGPFPEVVGLQGLAVAQLPAHQAGRRLRTVPSRNHGAWQAAATPRCCRAGPGLLGCPGLLFQTARADKQALALALSPPAGQHAA